MVIANIIFYHKEEEKIYLNRNIKEWIKNKFLIYFYKCKQKFWTILLKIQQKTNKWLIFLKRSVWKKIKFKFKKSQKIKFVIFS